MTFIAVVAACIITTVFMFIMGFFYECIFRYDRINTTFKKYKITRIDKDKHLLQIKLYGVYFYVVNEVWHSGYEASFFKVNTVDADFNKSKLKEFIDRYEYKKVTKLEFKDIEVLQDFEELQG